MKYSNMTLRVFIHLEVKILKQVFTALVITVFLFLRCQDYSYILQDQQQLFFYTQINIAKVCILYKQ